MKTIMRSRILGLTALVVTAIALLGSCNNKEEQPTQQTETATATTSEAVKTVEYTVVVNGGDTKATVDADMKTLRFAAGDKLYITADDRADLRGFLTLKDGDEGKTQGATFTGTLEYTGDAPASDLSVKATLVGSANQGFTLSGDGKAIEGGIVYPSASFCSDVNDAVEKYSNLTGTSTYGAGSFQLTQETAFLNFVITFEDGTDTDTYFSTVVVSNGGSAISTADVTTVTENKKVVAKFVLPVAGGTILSSATVKMGNKAALTISNATLTGKVYNVKKTQLTVLNLTNPACEQLIGNDGRNYNYNDLPSGVTPVAKIGYLNGSHGLALAMKDEGQMDWNTAKARCEAHTPAFAGGTWKLASKEELDNLISYGGHVAARTGFSIYGGFDMKKDKYWTSTLQGDYGNIAWYFNFASQSHNPADGWKIDSIISNNYARACLAF